MYVRDWMSPDPVAIRESTTVRQARAMLRNYGIRHLPVVRGDRLVGIVSDRDLFFAAQPGEQLVSDVMSAPPYVIGAAEPIEVAARLMLSRHISALPVLDEDRLVGIITTTDCLLASLGQPAVAQ